MQGEGDLPAIRKKIELLFMLDGVEDVKGDQHFLGSFLLGAALPLLPIHRHTLSCQRPNKTPRRLKREGIRLCHNGRGAPTTLPWLSWPQQFVGCGRPPGTVPLRQQGYLFPSINNEPTPMGQEAQTVRQSEGSISGRGGLLMYRIFYNKGYHVCLPSVFVLW